MDAIRLAGLVIYTLGAFAYVMPLAYWLIEAAQRDRGDGVEDSRPLGGALDGAMIAISFAWFCVNAVQAFLLFGPRIRIWQIDVLIILLAYSYPPLIMHTTLAQVVKVDASVRRGWRLALWPVYLVAALIPIGCLAVFLHPSAGATVNRVAGRTLGMSLPILFVIAAAYSIALISRQPADHEIRHRQERRWFVGLFGLMVLLFVTILSVGILSGGGSRPMAAAALLELEIAARSLPLVFIFVGAYFESRFDFFDVFVKRGAALVFSLIAAAGVLTVLLPLLRSMRQDWVAPWLYAVALLPFLAVLPWLHGRIGAVLDRRWLGRRFTAVAAVKQFVEALKLATNEGQLKERAQDGLMAVFGAPCLVQLRLEPGEAAPAFAVSHRAPIGAGDSPAGWILMGPRASEAPYFREDVELIASLSDVLASVLDNLQLQEKKKEQEQLAQEMSLHASRSELKALRAQINPHFLFNALNAIAGLIHRNPRAADRTIEQLADVFRYALRGEHEWASLGDELEFVRAYLEVERARFGDRLQTELSTAEDVRLARVPAMTVQTLVENAVKHGLSELRGTAVVRVVARREEDRLVVSVIDNGPGFSARALAKADEPPGPAGGYGLANIRQRLRGYFGGDAVLTIARDPQRAETIVSIVLPVVLDARGPAREATMPGHVAAPSAAQENGR